MMVVKRVEHINGSHESAPLVGGYNPYSIMDACGTSNASFFPMEEDPLIWTPPQPEDTEIVSYRISNLGDSTELSLASHASNSEFFEDHFIHRNVSDNMTLLLSNVSESVQRNLTQCLPGPISESVSSFYYGFKNEKSSSEFPTDLTQVTEIVIDDNTMKVKLQNKNHVESLLDSESILVLTSIHNVTKQAACEQSKLSLIKFYADFDATLGQYLQDILLSQKYTCSSCGELSEAHIYRYTHQNGTLAAIVKQLPKGSVLPGEAEGKIWMWNRCLKCNHHKGVSKASRRVVMSFAASQLSFGKFLYLSFSNHLETNRLSRCGHLLHKDCLQFFGLGSKVAMFRYSPIEIYTACKPQLWLETYNQNKQLGEMKEAKEVLKMVELLFEEVAKILKKLKSHFACSIQKQPDKLSGIMEHIDEVENMLKQDKTVFESSLLKAVNQGAKQGKNVNENLDFSWLLKELHFMLYVWNRRLHVLSQDVGYISSKLCSANQDILEIDLKNKPSTVSELAPSSSNPCFNVYKEVLVPILDHIQQEKFQSVAIVPLSNAEEATNSEPIPRSNENSLHSDNPGHWIWTPFSEMQKDFKKDINGSSLHKFQLHFAENEVSGVIASALVSYSDRSGPVDIIFDKEVIGKLDQTVNISKSTYPASLEPDEFSVYPLVYQLITSDNLHPEISLDPYKIAGRCKYTVICIYAKEFCSLRNQWFLSEQAYISSLSCSKKWDAQGGKSKVYFAKTIDEKLILKQLKKAELDSFLNFGPQYFNYVSLSAASGNQTCLAKIFGIYQVRKVINGKEVKTDLIMVMENLFSGRNITRKYDLKGATFSRYISDANDRDIVLLDENFINDMCISPMYFKETSKHLMERSIRNDTSFLASINVMDYSLLVGVDRESHELVFGIIDYVRQYTWDKQLETWVKSSLIVPKNALPTVVSPKEYRKRFLKFLSKHILAVPDAWSCR